MDPETQEIPIDQLPMKEYNAARDKGLSVVEVEKPEQEETQEAEKPKAKGGFQKRIDRLIKEQAELEKKVEAANRRAAEAEARTGKPAEQKQAVVEGAPKLEDFGTHEDWVRATARWEAKQELRAEREAEREAARQQSTKVIFDAHNERLIEARARIEDFDEAMETKGPWMDNDPDDQQSARAFQLAIFESDNGPDVLYFLGTHPEEFEKLGELTPSKVQRAVWKISESLEGKKSKPAEDEVEEDEPEKEEKPKSKAPAPIKPVTGGSTRSSKRLDDMTMAEYNKARDAGRIV
jgi:hypothetical protein